MPLGAEHLWTATKFRDGPECSGVDLRHSPVQQGSPDWEPTPGETPRRKRSNQA
jgi:hypothetical protein